jgi:hypothetical protein
MDKDFSKKRHEAIVITKKIITHHLNFLKVVGGFGGFPDDDQSPFSIIAHSNANDVAQKICNLKCFKECDKPDGDHGCQDLFLKTMLLTFKSWIKVMDEKLGYSHNRTF